MTNKQILHITNSSGLTSYLKKINISGDFLTWFEMLCEGPTQEIIDTDEFIKQRQMFLSSYYNVDANNYTFKNEIEKLNQPQNYSEIVLWFEYDLFCHINLIAAVSLIQQKKIKLPLYLVCSGKIDGEKDLKGLSELSPKQLQNHYKNKVKLNPDDIDLAKTLWNIYCGKDHNLIKPYIVKKSSYKYLSHSLKAHLQRFPDSKHGLGTLGYNVLKIIKSNVIKSKHHLLGYMLNYQGYYGFGDMQLKRMIDKLSIFFSEENNAITLNENGNKALLGLYNFASKINNDLALGGVNRLNFMFSREDNKLLKTFVNAY